MTISLTNTHDDYHMPPGLRPPRHNDGLSSTRGLRGTFDLGGILRGEEHLVTSTTPVGLPSPTFIDVIGEELPQIPGCDVRGHGTTCSL